MPTSLEALKHLRSQNTTPLSPLPTTESRDNSLLDPLNGGVVQQKQSVAPTDHNQPPATPLTATAFLPVLSPPQSSPPQTVPPRRSGRIREQTKHLQYHKLGECS